MKKLFIAVLLMLGVSADIFAQQDSEYTHYMFNSLVLNPGYAGSRGALSGTAIYRHQWAGITGAPRTFSLAGHSPFGERVGVGLYMESDRVGVHNRLSLFGSYAYRIPIAADGNLSLGIQAGFRNYVSDWNDSDLNIQNTSDPSLSGKQSKLLPNFGLGAYYYTERYYVGLSIPHLIDNKLDKVQELAKEYKHYFLTGGVVLDISPTVKFKPSVLLKSVPAVAPLEVDINLNFLFQDALWAGVGYRTADALLFMLEYQFANGLRLGYSYDLTLTQLGAHNSGSHEIMLGWDLAGGLGGGGGDGDKVLSPRFF